MGTESWPHVDPDIRFVSEHAAIAWGESAIRLSFGEGFLNFFGAAWRRDSVHPRSNFHVHIVEDGISTLSIYTNIYYSCTQSTTFQYTLMMSSLGLSLGTGIEVVYLVLRTLLHNLICTRYTTLEPTHPVERTFAVIAPSLRGRVFRKTYRDTYITYNNADDRHQRK